MVIPAFGRKYEVSVMTRDEEIVISSDSFEPEALRVTFDIAQLGYQAWWYGEIVIYNLDERITNKILRQGDSVTVKAGYQNGVYGQIFKGKLFQPLWERENVVDFKLTLHCVTGMAADFISFTQSAGYTQSVLVQQIVKQAFLNSDAVGPVKTTQMPRAKTVFGSPSRYLTQIAEDNNMQWWLSDNGLNLGSVGDPSPEQALVFTPSTNDDSGTIVGTPQQTMDGITFTVLLDSRLRVKLPPMQVKIDNTSIQLQKAQIGQLMSILDQNGFYVVGAVRHIGDTRGNSWYTEVVGYTTVSGKLSMLAEAQQADLSQSRDGGH